MQKNKVRWQHVFRQAGAQLSAQILRRFIAGLSADDIDLLADRLTAEFPDGGES